ncbi:NAD(P)-binding protein [Gymnopus androsaceus JB14]|uniref:NAD(P)-binding protein n=1 Tax=Gymnopus androsaceus JB14 TaxID=1447944 RepID=A0A6A4HH43_9AGAR|nr:NAD(P)-binding protein [Gymnopus androsaceus JB14]
MSQSKGVALITGSAQGIGKAIALRLASRCKVEQLEDVVKEIQALGRKSGVFVGDVSDEESVKSMIQETVKHLGSLDVLAYTSHVQTLLFSTNLTAPVEEWDRAFAVNARGTFFMISQNHGGRIIGASSVSGKRARRNGFAIRGMTQAAALDLAQYGITVNAYAPDIHDGYGLKDNLAELLANDLDGSKRKEYIGNIPLGRMGQPNDIAGVVSYLASKDSSYVTGI